MERQRRAPSEAPGLSAEVPAGSEEKREAKEALARLLQVRQKELLRLKMQAQEKQLALLRGRLAQERRLAVGSVPTAPSAEAPVAAAAARDAAEVSEARIQESRKQLAAVLERRRAG
ncbi:unnamed protein product, partial [Polarella glacialis]